jgi:hypothetical protein
MRLRAKGLHVQGGAFSKWFCSTHRVNTRQKAANPLQRVQLVQLWPAPAFARADAVAKAVRVVQGLAVQGNRRCKWNLCAGQLGGEGVFFQYLRIPPALGAVKLGHHGIAQVVVNRVTTVFLDMRQIHAVLVARQRHQTAVAAHASGFQGVKYHLGCQGFKGMGGQGHWTEGIYSGFRPVAQ